MAWQLPELRKITLISTMSGLVFFILIALPMLAVNRPR
jgi:hypothetical protein